MKRLVLPLLVLLTSLLILVSGCGGGFLTSVTPAIAVSITPSTATVQIGGTLTINATANNDPSGAGVSWTLSPASGAGTLTNMTTTSVVYNAPSSPPASHVTVTITATAVKDASKSSSATVTLPSVAVSIVPSTATIIAGGTQTFTAAVQNDPANKGVTWAISPASGAGTLTNASSTSVTYNAPADPASLPAQGQALTITAVSAADPLGLSSAAVTVPPISVIVTPNSATVPATGTQDLTATVQNDPANKGVTWSIVSPATGGGSLSNATSTSVTYNAPADAPASDMDVEIRAASVSDPRQSSYSSITVPAIKVSVSPASGQIPITAGQEFTAVAQYDPKANGVTWALSQSGSACSPACGTISATASASSAPITYTAPTSVPSNPAVTLTATSTSDTSKSGTAAITILIGTVKLVPGSLDFGAVKAQDSKTLATALTNTGASTLSITGIAITGTNASVFSLVNPTCGTSVGPGISCPITVTFKPPTAVSFSANITITDSSVGSPQQVPLSGNGEIAAAIAKAAHSAVTTNRTIAVPSVTGPENVGTRTIRLVDTTRNDPYLGDGTRRELLARFWYPASLAQGCRAAEYTSPRVWTHFSQLLGMWLPEVRTNSCLDAPVTPGAHPIVVFTPGYTGTFTDYTFLFEDLASRGYVVASIDHTYEASAVEFPDGRFANSVFGSYLGDNARSDPEAFALAVSVRLSDLKFVVDELESLNADVQSPFHGKLDLSRVALAGHSMGGLTAVLGVAAEPRFRAGIVLDGVMPERWTGAIDKPMLIIRAGSREWGPDENRLWDSLRGPKFTVKLRGAEHITPSDMVWLAKGAVQTGSMDAETTVDALRNYVAAFLEVNLRGERLDPLLTGPSPKYPDVEVSHPQHRSEP